MLRNIRQLFLIILCGGLLLSCEAERDNPRDPKSPYYTGEGSLRGSVKTRTGVPLPGITLVVEPETTACLFTTSNEDGSYNFSSVPAGKCMVIASKEGYETDTCPGSIEVEGADTVDFFLDALPRFLLCQVTTHHVLQKYYAIFEADAVDGDGAIDIDFVSSWVTGFQDPFDLYFDADKKKYTKQVDAESLPGKSLESLLGKDCFFEVTDKAGARVKSQPTSPARIIYEEPDLVKPVNFEKVGTNPVLIWHKPTFTYPYTYTVEVFRLQSGQPLERMWFRECIPKIDTAVTVTQELKADNYSWMVWVVDEFGNSTRSVLAGFQVQ